MCLLWSHISAKHSQISSWIFSDILEPEIRDVSARRQSTVCNLIHIFFLHQTLWDHWVSLRILKLQNSGRDITICQYYYSPALTFSTEWQMEKEGQSPLTESKWNWNVKLQDYLSWLNWPAECSAVTGGERLIPHRTPPLHLCQSPGTAVRLELFSFISLRQLCWLIFLFDVWNDCLTEFTI